MSEFSKDLLLSHAHKKSFISSLLWEDMIESNKIILEVNDIDFG